MRTFAQLMASVNPVTYAAEGHKLKHEMRVHAHKGGRRMKSRAPKHVWLTRFVTAGREAQG